ncbi:Mechanosensitive ion channel-domain-containing protein [Apodospora peruviana]|uniref:Mechanosensitive ion channel protein n=1 Tax=Apodospora peruviana TaxID=516989 RepID=A0AAE0MAN4_9PEZI|nr:Mechanosensitive ion channel-domain-containing protein [Apodospora peruviana]
MASPVEMHEMPHRPPPTGPVLHIQMSSSAQTPADEFDEKTMDPSHLQADPAAFSPSGSREQANRLNDDLELLRAERVVSQQAHDQASRRSRSRNRSDRDRLDDTFNTTAAPAQPKSSSKKTWLTSFWDLIKKFPRVLRYILYAIPPAVLILIPIFLDIYGLDSTSKPVGGNGGVQLMWFGIWLEVIWLAFWASRIVLSIMPLIMGGLADAVGSSNHKKWKDIGRQLEFPTALFIWQLVILVSYDPILNDHRALGPDTDPDADLPDITWVRVVYKVVIALFVLATLNFLEKILIQWIAGSFHLRTYSHRIRENQMQIDSLVALYSYAKNRLEAQDPVWDSSGGGGLSSGSRTPMKAIQSNARHALSKVGNAATRFAGDFTGRRTLKGNQSRKVVVELLRNTDSSYTLARVFYRTFVAPDKSSITMEDLLPAFESQEDAEACFSVFDKDLNGDISMEELEMVCNEIHLEKKAIAASLKDLDSVIKKLDNVFMFIVIVIVVIVFISIISNSAAAALTSTGSFILGLSWLLQATAQEFLQSIIFVFVKHPFDVGDRVTVYGNTGSLMRGDDYYVLEVSLLYTEFKKMEGHVVQAPNSLLNTLFILNQRRSQGLADPVNLTLRFGTTEAQIEELKARMLEFCLQNKRDYAPKIISEVRTIDEVYSINMNIIFFHKSNYQNELLRLTRHNKFAVELMRHMHEMGLQGPRVVQPGGMREMPVYWSQVQPPPAYNQHHPYGHQQQQHQTPVTSAPQPPPPAPSARSNSAVQRMRGDSRAAVVEAGLDFQDVYQNRSRDGGIVRLRSINQSPREDLTDDGHGGMGERLERLESVPTRESGSTRRRMHVWNRPRRESTSTGPPAGNVV